MPRRREIEKRTQQPDPVFNLALVSRFINSKGSPSLYWEPMVGFVMNSASHSTASKRITYCR